MQSRACARRTLTLALSHKGRGGDPLADIRTWFRADGFCNRLDFRARLNGVVVSGAGVNVQRRRRVHDAGARGQGA